MKSNFKRAKQLLKYIFLGFMVYAWLTFSLNFLIWFPNIPQGILKFYAIIIGGSFVIGGIFVLLNFFDPES